MSTSSPDAPTCVDAVVLRNLLATHRVSRLIDVRTPGEFQTAHIPGSHNVPLPLLSDHGDTLGAHLDGPVVLVCRSGRRAATARQVLADAGLPDLRVLTGGLNAWQAIGGPLITGTPRWDLERQVRLVAGGGVLLSLLAGTVVPAARWGAAFIGAGLTFAAVSDTCALGMLLAKLPYNRGPRPDLGAVPTTLADPRP